MFIASDRTKILMVVAVHNAVGVQPNWPFLVDQGSALGMSVDATDDAIRSLVRDGLVETLTPTGPFGTPSCFRTTVAAAATVSTLFD